MDPFESLVARFLANNSLFISPQYSLHEEPNWNASIDFLVLDFDGKCVIAVEVSDASGLGSVAAKASNFIKFDYFDKISKQITRQTHGLTEGWAISFLGFVRDEALVEEAWRSYPDRRLFFRPMKDTIEDYWSVRKNGLLPIRPTMVD